MRKKVKELQGYKEEPIILRNTVHLVRITTSVYVCMHVRTVHVSGYISPSLLQLALVI